MIAKHYLMRSFIFDLLAWVPFDLIVEQDNDKARLWRLFKLLRIPRLIELLNVERVKQIVTNHYNKQLEENVKANRFNKPYPIMKTLLIIKVYQIF